MSEEIIERACSSCGEVKPRTLENFMSGLGCREGLTAECRICNRARGRCYYRANRERALASNSAWVKKNAERVNARRRERKAGISRTAGYKVIDREAFLARRRARCAAQLPNRRRAAAVRRLAQLRQKVAELEATLGN
jgi:hypothetical protein